MLRLIKLFFIAAVGVFVLALIYGMYVVFLNPSLDMTVNKQSIALLWDSPELTTQLGAIEGTMFDYHSGKLDDASWDKRARDMEFAAANLAAIDAYDRSSLDEQEQITQEMMVWFYQTQLGYRDIAWLAPGNAPYPINQMFGEQNGFPRFMQFSHAVTNEVTARTYVERLRAMGVKFDQIIDVVKRQDALGARPPLFVFDKVLTEMNGFVGQPAKQNPLYVTYVERLNKLEIAQSLKDKYAADTEAAINEVVYPAYKRLIETMTALKARASPEPGIWNQPNGDAYYALALKEQTTTDMTPEEVHQVGLSEIARITGEMDTILKSLGLTEGTVGARMKMLGEMPQYLFEDSEAGRAAILAEYTRILNEMKGRLPTVFATIPPQELEVQRVPVFTEGSSSGAYYNQPALDGSRPGRFFSNLRDVKETPKWSMKTLAYHEGVPGHHMQIASAMNLDLPMARRFLGSTAYIEGWALYAEQLAYEMGEYNDDPAGNLGRLQAELFRASRLVVDTGMHHKHWSREQAIQSMVDATGMAESDVTAEVERYAVMPGQACAYKIGMMKILELRERAKQALGPKFDIKAFHTVVLGNGPLPLTILEKVVDDWIAKQKGAA